MPWGFFGPITIRTRRGHRVTIVAGFITLPLFGWSVWNVLKGTRGSTISGGEIVSDHHLGLDREIHALESSSNGVDGQKINDR